MGLSPRLPCMLTVSLASYAVFWLAAWQDEVVTPATAVEGHPASTVGSAVPRADEAVPLRAGVWVEIYGTGSCLSLRSVLIEARSDDPLYLTTCQPDGFVGYIAAGPMDVDGRRWWGLAGLGWAPEDFLRFHHEGDLPWPVWPELLDAGQIGYVGPDDNVWLMEGDGTRKRVMAASPGGRVLLPAWSPAGSHLAFTAEHRSPRFPPRYELHVIDSEGEYLLWIDEASFGGWSPAEQLLFYVSPHPFDPNRVLKISDLSGRTIRELPATIIARWSPDGRSISVLTEAGIGGLWPSVTASILDLDIGPTWVIEADASVETFYHGPPQFSPDGRWVSHGHRLFDRRTRELEGSLPGQALLWFPDGTLLLLTREPSWSRQVYDPSTGQVVHELEWQPAPGDAPPWAAGIESLVKTADGRWLVYYDWGQFSEPARPNALRIFDLVNGSSRSVPLPPIDYLELSPNGRHVLFTSSLRISASPPVRTTWIWVIDVDGENLTLLGGGSTARWRPQGASGLEGAGAEVAVPLAVFLARNPESYEDFAAAFPVVRAAARGADEVLATAALESLIRGPTPEEVAAGYFSELSVMLYGDSDCGGQDFTLLIHDGVAVVHFCRHLLSSGVGQDARARSTIEATLSQFAQVRDIVLLGKGNGCLFDESGLDLCLARLPEKARAPED